MLPFISPKFNPDRIFNIKEWDFEWYKHVGLQLFQKEDEPMDVSYPFKEGIFSEIRRTLKSNVVFSLPGIFKALDTHTLPEYQKRLFNAIKKEQEHLNKATEEEKATSIKTLSLKEYYSQGKQIVEGTEKSIVKENVSPSSREEVFELDKETEKTILDTIVKEKGPLTSIGEEETEQAENI